MSIEKQNFGKTPDSLDVEMYTLKNTNGFEAKIITYGGILVSLKVPDRNGNFSDIVLGYKNLEKYIEDNPAFGAIVGRYANRIAKGKFTLDGIEYTLATNHGPNHLHGGIKGFDKVIWTAEPLSTDKGHALKLTYLSKDGEEGYPGNLSCTIIYTLTDDNELKISYEAETDKPTVLNLTNHSYFNLAGHDSGNILGHELTIYAKNYTDIDEELIPTGQIKSVAGTPLDFTTQKTIGCDISQTKTGYDHNYVLDKTDDSLAKAAYVYEPGTGRVMELYTTEPALQLYTGNWLNHNGKAAKYSRHCGFCLEAQHYPDSPNHPEFPSTILRPGEKYTQLTVHKFSVK